MKIYTTDRDMAGNWIPTGKTVRKNRQSQAIKHFERMFPGERIRVRLLSVVAKISFQ